MICKTCKVDKPMKYFNSSGLRAASCNLCHYFQSKLMDNYHGTKEEVEKLYPHASRQRWINLVEGKRGYSKHKI